MTRLFRCLLAVLAALVVAACSTTNSTPINTVPLQAPPATTAAPAGRGLIVVSGDLETTLLPESRVAVQVDEQITLALSAADQGTAVTLSFPAALKPATYDIGDLFNRAAADVTARLTALQDGQVTTYESTSGNLTLTGTGVDYYGSYFFNAASTPDGAKTVTVVGNFDTVILSTTP